MKKIYEIDFKNWPNFLDMLNHFLNPWDLDPEGWEGYDWDEGVFSYQADDASEVTAILHPALEAAQKNVEMIEEDHIRDVHISELNSLNVYLLLLE